MPQAFCQERVGKAMTRRENMPALHPAVANGARRCQNSCLYVFSRLCSTSVSGGGSAAHNSRAHADRQTHHTGRWAI